MKTIENLINKYCFKKVSNINFIFLRAATALLTFILLLTIYNDATNILASKSYINHEIFQATEFGYEPRLEWLTVFMENYLGIGELVAIKICLITCMISLIFLGLGIGTRFFALVAVILWAMFLNSSRPFHYGVDYFILSALFYCFVFPSGGFLRFWATSKIQTQPVFYIFTLVLKIHLSIAYFFNGLAKSLGQTWWNGEAIWRAVNMGDNPMTIELIAQYPMISTVSTFLVLFCELLHPLLMLFYPSRAMTLMVIVGMHVFIALFMNLYFFSAMMIILNVAAYWATFSKMGEQAKARLQTRLRPQLRWTF